MSEKTLSKSQSEPAGKNAAEKTAVSEMLTSPSAKSQYEDDPILATLKRSPMKKRSPGSKWDGRVAGMTVKEYRERKWSVDAAYKSQLDRRMPSYSMRIPLPTFFGKKNTNFTAGDPVRSLNATLRSSPSYSMGVQYFQPPPDKSQGPAEYAIQSTMDPSRHPTISKNTGPRFGTEVLEPRDPAGPAPGDYDPNAIVHSSTLKKPPNFTIQGREAWRDPTAAPGPGVGEFQFDHCLRTGKLSPIKWGIQGRGDPLAKPLGQRQYELPGPAHYSGPGAGQQTHPMRAQAPLWKFGSEPRGLRN